MDFTKFLRTHFLQNTSGRLLLLSYISEHLVGRNLLLGSYDADSYSEPSQASRVKLFDISCIFLIFLITAVVHGMLKSQKVGEEYNLH